MQHLAGICLVLALGTTTGAYADDHGEWRLSGTVTPAAAASTGGSGTRLEQIVGQAVSQTHSADSSLHLRHGWTIPPAVTKLFRYALEAGWGLKGSPGLTAASIAHIFSGPAGAPIKVGDIQYPTVGGDVVAAADTDPLLAKRAFWVFSYWGGQGHAFETPDVDTPRSASHWTDDLDSGWNLYSPPFYVTVPERTVIGAVWRWDASAASYQLVTPGSLLVPLEGYWVFRAPPTP